MFALTGRYRRFGGFKKNGKDDARVGVFRKKIAAAVRLDLVGLCGEACAVKFERPGLPGQPDVGRGGRRSILRASRYERKQRKGEGDEETSFHADLRNRCPSAHSTREVAKPVKPRNTAYRIEKHPVGGTEFRAKNLLLRDFVEGENSVGGCGLRLLDPTGAVSNAVALHLVVEFYGCGS